jgi:2',3'-cyclic-nucleotide 2'-phosphodiesterase (5'-nucleotidase family)
VAVVNPGLLRAGPPLSGAVTEGDLRSITPFQNEVLVAPIDGADLRALFADRTRVRHDVPEVTVHVSGASLRWERGPASCQLRAATVGGDPIGPEETYRIASTSYPFYASSFAQLDPAPATTVCDLGEAVVEYARAEGLSMGRDGRIVAEADALDGAGASLS